jgi:ABC-2 type transport system permease protein
VSRTVAILRKEFLQMRRDRMTVGLAFLMPLIQLLLFGYAIQTDVRHIPTAVFDQAHSAASRDLLEAFTASGYFDLTVVADSPEAVSQAIDRGRAKAGILIPPDLDRCLARGDSAAVQVVVDASDNLVANQALAVANAIGLLKSQAVLVRRLGISGPLYDVRMRPWYNPDGITAFYMVPALLGTIVTMTMVILTAAAIVREKERGTLEQLIVTPVRSLELMVGKIVPYIALGYVQITVALLVAVTVFRVPIRGSVLELYLLTLFFITASLGLGILLSTLAQNQLQAFQLSFLVLLPSILLSGFLFPREAMPEVVYYLSTVIPLTYYLQIIRGIVLKGVGLPYLVGQVAALLVFSVVFVTLSAVRFKKRIA